MSDETMHIRDYVQTHRIKVERRMGDPKHVVDDDGWEHRAYNLRLVSPTAAKPMLIPWKQGMAINTDPSLTPVEVFASVVEDAASADNARSFEEWAGEFGYDTDSRKAEAIYKECLSLRDRLIKFLGSKAEFIKLAYEVDREL